MIFYHKILVVVLLIGVVLGFILPIGDDIKRVKKRFRVYTFTLHALIATAGFGGLITFIFAKREIDLNISIMILSYIALTLFEVIKYFKVLKAKEIKEIRAINLKWTLLSTITILLNFWRY